MFLETLLIVSLAAGATAGIKWMMEQNKKTPNYPEEWETYIGKEALVIKEVSFTHMQGRIRFLDTTWPAISGTGESIPENTMVTILTLKDVGWVVVPQK